MREEGKNTIVRNGWEIPFLLSLHCLNNIAFQLLQLSFGYFKFQLFFVLRQIFSSNSKSNIKPPKSEKKARGNITHLFEGHSNNQMESKTKSKTANWQHTKNRLYNFWTSNNGMQGSRFLKRTKIHKPLYIRKLNWHLPSIQSKFFTNILYHNFLL